MKPYFETPNGVLYCGDCLEILPMLEPVDLVLTDPPYGLDKKLSQGAGKHKNAKFRTNYEGQSWDKAISKDHFKAIFDVSINQIIFGANYYEMPPTRGIVCWDKRQAMPTFSAWEYAWTSFQCPAKIYHVCNGVEERFHPTQKPVFLFCLILKDFRGEPVLDPFIGSGTTAVACEQLGRKWVGIEISEKYCEIAAKRIERERQQLKLFPPEKPTPKPIQETLF